MRRVLPLVLVAACGHAAPPAVTTAPASTPTAPAAPAATPPAPAHGPRTVDVHDTQFGTTVTDPYRWMEDPKNAPELATWLRAEGARTRAYLDHLPGRAALLARTLALANATTGAGTVELAGGRMFFLYAAPGDQLAKLVVRERGKDRVLVDPAKLGDADHHAALGSYMASPDGSHVAYHVSLGGGEIGTIRVVDVATGKDLPDAVERIWGEFRALWLPDGKGFFYTQMAPPKDGVDPMLGMQSRLHLLGQPTTADVPVLGGGLGGATHATPDEFAWIDVRPGTAWMIGILGGAHDNVRIVVAPLAALDRKGTDKTPWVPVAGYTDDVNDYEVHGDRLYLISQAGASNKKIISVPLAHPVLAGARVEIAEDPEQPIVRTATARDGVYIVKQHDGLSHLYRWKWTGKPTEIALPFPGWIDDLGFDPLRDGVVISEQGWTRPTSYFTVDAKTGRTASAGLDTVSTADYSGIVADEVIAPSDGGVGVPLSIIHREDLGATGKAPAIVDGYAGYGISTTPDFSPSRLAWLERGGVFAYCHGRGGGERGHQWALDGTHEHKMTGVHDLEACARYLADHEISDAAHTFAQGASMGGVLIGRAITDRPELFAAASISVGILDPVRILAAANGASQLGELGDPRTEAGFKAIYEMSPYAHATAMAYPATLFSIGLNDGRVAPWMTAKMAARVQAATTGGKPVMIRVEEDAGHGIGSTVDQGVTARVDEWCFFLAAAGDPAFAAPAAAR